MFKYLGNVIGTIGISLFTIIMTIITGKLSKISNYHLIHDSIECDGPLDICSDKLIKTNFSSNVSINCQKSIIMDFIDSLNKNQRFKNPTSQVKYPIFNGQSLIGTQGYYPVLLKCLDEYINDDIIKEFNK